MTHISELGESWRMRRPFHDAMPRHRTAGPRLGAIASASSNVAHPPPPLAPSHHPLPHPATCSLIYLTPSPSPCLFLLHPPPPLPLHGGWPCVHGCPSVPPDDRPPRRGEPRVPAGACDVCVVVRLSPAVLHTGLRWLRGSGDDPAGCAR